MESGLFSLTLRRNKALAKGFERLQGRQEGVPTGIRLGRQLPTENPVGFGDFPSFPIGSIPPNTKNAHPSGTPVIRF